MKLRKLLLLCAVALPVLGDEGIWLFNQFPKSVVKEKREFDVTDQYLENLRLASMQLGAGSGAFVSAHGLILTAHRVVSACVAKVGGGQHDYLKDGFYAASQAEEIKCPDLELNVLQAISDVTAEVNGAVKPEMTPAEAFAARRAVMARIEKESLDSTGLRSDVVHVSGLVAMVGERR